ATKDTLPRLGPDWGFCITPSPEKTALPQFTAALRIREGPNKAATEQALLKALDTAAALAVWSNADNLRLKEEMQGAVKVKYLLPGKGAPPALQPAYALKGGYLVLASSPAAMRQFAASGTKVEAPPDPKKTGSVEAPLVRISLRQLSKFLKDRRDPLVELLAE